MTANLISNIHLAGSEGATPEVGMGATICHYTDRNAATVVAVRFKRDGSVKEIDVRQDKAIRTDSNGMSDAQSYRYEPNEDAPVNTWRVDSQGRFRRLATDWEGKLRMESWRGGSKLALGIRDEFYDYTF